MNKRLDYDCKIALLEVLRGFFFDQRCERVFFRKGINIVVVVVAVAVAVAAAAAAAAAAASDEDTVDYNFLDRLYPPIWEVNFVLIAAEY